MNVQTNGPVSCNNIPTLNSPALGQCKELLYPELLGKCEFYSFKIPPETPLHSRVKVYPNGTKIYERDQNRRLESPNPQLVFNFESLPRNIHLLSLVFFFQKLGIHIDGFRRIERAKSTSRCTVELNNEITARKVQALGELILFDINGAWFNSAKKEGRLEKNQILMKKLAAAKKKEAESKGLPGKLFHIEMPKNTTSPSKSSGVCVVSKAYRTSYL